MSTKKLEHQPDGFNLYVMAGDLNGHCKRCGAISTIEYRGLDPVFADFHIICNQCRTYTPMKIRMMPKYFTPEPYRGRRLFEKWKMKMAGGRSSLHSDNVRFGRRSMPDPVYREPDDSHLVLSGCYAN